MSNNNEAKILVLAGRVAFAGMIISVPFFE